MVKILVADDNSNVHKTLTLALADLGVEVISVNNGEAAVRKLADVSPDLVLADIFMPVRNGYEVCEYIKKDPRFAHVPVVLLVGAFDPLDEREAQRVGADGILKKPFVPPDPLITMVKTLLDRSVGERSIAEAASKPPVAAQLKTKSGVVAEPHVPPVLMPEEASSEELPVAAGRVSFGEGDRPVAFGQLLDSPGRTTSTSSTDVIEPIDDEQILTSSRDATLGEPVFWRNDSPEVEPEAETAPVNPDNKDELSLRKWGEEEESLPRREDAALLRPVEPLEVVREDREQQEDASPSLIDSEPVVPDPAAQSPLTVDSAKPPELAANPMEWLATAPTAHPDAAPEATSGWGEPNPAGLHASLEAFKVKVEPFSGGLQVEPEPFPGGFQVEPTPFPDAFKPMDAAEPSPHSEVGVEHDTTSAANAKFSLQSPQAPPTVQAPEDTARSVPIHKWAEMTDSLEDRATEIAAPHVDSISTPPAQVPAPPEAIPQLAAVKTLQTSNPASTSLREALNAAATIRPATSPNLAAPGGPPASAAPDPALVDAVVQRVLDKMRPQVVDIITKEFLRPIVEALVHREIEKQ